MKIANTASERAGQQKRQHTRSFHTSKKTLNKRNIHPDNTHLSQSRPLDIVLVRLQCPKDSPFLAFLCSGQVLNVSMSALSFYIV
jgi:hypothetical protein